MHLKSKLATFKCPLIKFYLRENKKTDYVSTKKKNNSPIWSKNDT